jgi:tetrathionate reductase subunit B
MKVLIIDISKCNGCYNCQIACKDEHVDNEWLPYAKSQPDTGQFWMKVSEQVRGTVPKVKISYRHEICQQCMNAPCLSACRQQAIYRREDGIVIIDPGKCTGSKKCISACPYGVIYFNQTANLAQKCTMCAHLLDKGWQEPRCVEVCPTGALQFGEENELKEAIKKASVLHPEYGTKPRVYYLGLPQKFIAGTVFAPEDDECVNGASVIVSDGNTGEQFSVETDIFGDFWVENLKQSNYSVAISKSGYKTIKINNLETQHDINLGDIKMFKNT